MLKSLIIFALFCAGAETAPQTPIEVDKPDLEPLWSREADLVEVVRQFDLRQKALAEWDLKLADQYAKAGSADLAQDKSRQASRRYRAIQDLYEEVMKHYPNNARVLTYYGELQYDQIGDQTKAIMLWKAANAADPKLPEPLNNLGIHYCHTGDYEQGLRCFDEVLKLAPNNPDFLFNVAQIYLINFPQVQQYKSWKREKVYAEAMKLSKKAAELLPTSYDIVVDYAVNFFAAENFGVKANWKEAAEAWQRARQQAYKMDQTFYTWLNEARAWIRQGNKTDARRCLEEARKLFPKSDAVATLTAQIESDKS